MYSHDERDPRTTLAALGLVVVLLAGFALLPQVFKRHEAKIVGSEAPDFTLALVANGAALGSDKRTLALHDLRGRAVLLDFWATWCPPCRTEAPIIDQLARRWHDRGVVVVGIDTDSVDQGDPHEFALAHGLTYPIVQDTSGEAEHTYEVENLPTLVVVSRTGKVVAVRTGITDDAELERLIRQAL
jgi:thiol-disulfide isomerase/thioredoxin